MRSMALDVGAKTIGVAVSDELGMIGHPLATLQRRGNQADAGAIAALVAEREVGDLVVGLPLELSGAAGPAARRVRDLVAVLRERLGDTVAIHEWDERFSTAAVKRALIEGDLSRRRRRQVIDQHAAAYILQGWLDARRRT